MSTKLITRWDETKERDRITAYVDAQVLEPESVFPGWTNLTSQSSVREIAIAPKSRHMWMATWGGVLSWRQREESIYYRYASEQGLACNAVSSVCVDETERPWAGHEEGGLSYFDGQRWQVYAELQDESIRKVSGGGALSGIWAAASRAVYYVASPQAQPLVVAENEEGSLNALALLADGETLLLGNGAGLFRLGRDVAPVRLAPEEIEHCVALARDGRGRVWLATPEQLYELEEGERARPSLYDGSAGRLLGIAAAQAKVWLLTDSALCLVSEEAVEVVPFDENQPRPLTIAASLNDNYVWVGTDRILSGLFYEKTAKARWDEDLLPLHAEDALSNLGRSIAASAASGKIWIGTAAGLLACEAPDKWSVNESAGDVLALCVTRFGAQGEEEETVWTLAWPRGISAPGHAEQPPGIPLALAAGQDGCAHALTSRGLYRLSNSPALIAEDAPPSPHSLAQTPDRVWWVGTTEGVYYQSGGGAWRLANERPGPLLEEVHGLAVHDAALWVATASGLWKRAGARWESHLAESKRHVRALCGACGEGKLWLAYDDGVMLYDAIERRVDRDYNRAESGLASRRVVALMEQGGALWIVTEAGISILKL